MYCNVPIKQRKFKKTKTYIFKKTLSFPTVYSKCGYEYKKNI